MKPLKVRFRLHFVVYPMDLKAEFESSDEKLNRIYDICRWTQQCCMLDAYVDCPWREQAQWWGDARIQALNTFYLSADTRLFKRGIIQIGSQTIPNGLTYGHAPTISHHCILPDYTLIWIITFWDYYWQTGDISLFDSHKAKVKKALNYFEDIKSKNGLLPFDDRYWLFLDWAVLFKDGYSTLYNLLYVMTLRYAEKLFELSNDKKNARRCKKTKKELISNIKKRLWNENKKSFYGGLDWNENPVEQESAHLLSFALLLDIFPKYNGSFVDRLLSILYGKRHDSFIPSPFFMYYVFKALKKYKFNYEVIDLIVKLWGKMLDKELSTTEEIWDAQPGYDSLCHAWSAHPIIHFSNVLLGITQTKPGWKEVIFSPYFPDIEYVNGKIATPLGVIESGWRRKGSEIEGFLDLPNGTKADIQMENIIEKNFKGRCRWIIPFTNKIYPK